MRKLDFSCTDGRETQHAATSVQGATQSSVVVVRDDMEPASTVESINKHLDY
jgi:hypothetical protein